MEGKPIDEWTLSEIQEIVEGIRFVHNLREVCADKIIELFKDIELVTLHKDYVAWKDEHKKEVEK